MHSLALFTQENDHVKVSSGVIGWLIQIYSLVHKPSEKGQNNSLH